MVKIEGIIIDIVYRNEDNGYTVLEIEIGGELTTAVGACPHVAVGEFARLYGVWTDHKSYGRQFKITSVETQLPDNPVSMEMYLSSGVIKGIGPATAEKLVATFGADTFEVIENDYARLSDIRGISKQMAQGIHDSFMETAALKGVIIQLQNLGLSVKQAFRAYEKYGTIAEELIKENPYRMIDDIYGIGFERADRIAETMGLAREAPFRVENGIKHTLKLALVEGHTCLPETMLLKKNCRNYWSIRGAGRKKLAAISDEWGSRSKIVFGGDRCFLDAGIYCRNRDSQTPVYADQSRSGYAR